MLALVANRLGRVPYEGNTVQVEAGIHHTSLFAYVMHLSIRFGVNLRNHVIGHY
jgi:hypothetical protein